jgi:hypothetical protein
MTYKVSVSNNSYSVKQASSPQFKVSAILGSGASEVANLSDLDDVNVSGIQNGFVLSYNAAQGKFVATNPDVVLEVAAADNVLPDVLIDALVPEIVPQLDLDAGGF